MYTFIWLSWSSITYLISMFTSTKSQRSRRGRFMLCIISRASNSLTFPGACAACLKQHKKCDEGRPSCNRCSRIGDTCRYERELRWFNGSKLPRTKRQATHRRRLLSSSEDHATTSTAMSSDNVREEDHDSSITSPTHATSSRPLFRTLLPAGQAQSSH